MKFMEKIRGIRFNWTIGLDTLLIVGSLLVTTGMLLQRVSNLETEQVRIQERIAAMDSRNTDDHKDIVKTLSGTAAMINLHLNQQP